MSRLRLFAKVRLSGFAIFAIVHLYPVKASELGYQGDILQGCYNACLADLLCVLKGS